MKSSYRNMNTVAKNSNKINYTPICDEAFKLKSLWNPTLESNLKYFVSTPLFKY
jgi:hypothetical protein